MVVPFLLTLVAAEKGAKSLKRANAISILAFFTTAKDPRVRDVLGKAFRDPNPSIRKAVWYGMVHWYVANRKSSASPFIAEMVAALDDPNPDVAKQARGSFFHLGEKGKSGVPYFLRALEDVRRRPDAVSALAEIGRNDPRVLPALMKYLKPDADKLTYLHIVSALGAYGQPKEVDRIVAVLIRELKRIGKGKGYEDLERQSTLIRALGRIGKPGKAAVPVLMEIVKQAPTGGMAADVISTLREIDPPSAKKATAIVLEAIRALRKSGPPSGKEVDIPRPKAP